MSSGALLPHRDALLKEMGTRSRLMIGPWVSRGRYRSRELYRCWPFLEACPTLSSTSTRAQRQRRSSLSLAAGPRPLQLQHSALPWTCALRLDNLKFPVLIGKRGWVLRAACREGECVGGQSSRD
jgi:hypothetical protein